MAAPTLLIFFSFLFHLFHLNLSESCPASFNCSSLGPLEFPFFNNNPKCGLFKINCSYPNPFILFGNRHTWYTVVQKISTNKFRIRDPILQNFLAWKSCFTFNNLALPVTPSTSFTITPSITMFTCIDPIRDKVSQQIQNFEYYNCTDFTVYYRNQTNGSANGQIVDRHLFPGCSEIQLPRNTNQVSNDIFEMLTAEFVLEWNISQDCDRCYHNRGGQCSTNNMNGFICKPGDKNQNRSTVLLASVISGGGVLVILAVSFIFWVRIKKIKNAYLISRNISSDPSSKSDLDVGCFYYGIPIFWYNELEEATNNFDPSKELGTGGFGTVYHGILKDGREVAIKRLYENNYKRVEQFMNEIQILTCLKHRNLVNLYGCTSRRSRELLLVYEYIPNGTVADHLHGERAKEMPLTWAVRMNIAIETASALAYLHKSDIVHRDVKTNNILLDSNFCVKVADFGLSRLFPTDVTHISTAPQGTPGYVDPEYHQCYQLTDKSDVYSFGVVLIELISSMPAVDIARHRHEINLANLAINRIQRCAFDELIDSSLGYKTDAEVLRMTTSVAELAFQCLQLEKDMRPSMDEILCFLRDIKNGAGKIPPSPETDEVELLKNRNLQCSPKAVTDVWIYSGSTSSSSVG